MLIRGADRFRSEYGAIVSWHCFSAGAHYDPARLGVGPLIGFDEHRVGPGGGFAEHAHRGVEIVSWVVEGTLRHVGDGAETIVRPGQVLVQNTGDGIRHSEWNASDTAPLRLVQMTLTGSGGLPSHRVAAPPVSTEEGRLSVARSGTVRVEPPCFVHATTGTARVGEGDQQVELQAGDSLAQERRATVAVDGEVLIWSLGRWN